MNPTVVIAYPGFGDIEIEKEILGGAGLDVVHTGTLETQAAREAARQADGLMVTIQPVPADLIEGMERCRIISRVGTGLDAIDLAAATARGIHVTYVPDYAIDEVSTHAVALLLAHVRGLLPLIESTRRGEWTNESIVPRPRLQGQILGLIGCGRIGRAVAAKARGVGMEVIGYDPYLSAETGEASGVRLVDLDELLRVADAISLHAPLTAASRHIIDARALALMKPSAFLINTARGPLIDEDALLQAVRSGQIAGAALDVLAVEPPPPDHPLLHEERVYVTPHTAWYSEAAKVDVRVRGAEEVVRVLRGESPRNAVNQVQRQSS